jgi:hypothetical protein
METFVKLDENNVVVWGCPLNNEILNNLTFPESEPVGIAYLTEWSQGYTNWKQTSSSGEYRKNPAGIGYTYDPTLDAFIPPKPYPSWILNTDKALWEAPIPLPDMKNLYRWDEETQSYIKIYEWNEETQSRKIIVGA